MNPVLLDIPEELHTERLIIRPPRVADAPAINGAVVESLERLRLWMPWATATLPTIAEREMWIKESYARFFLRQDFIFMMFDRTDGELVGGCGVHRLEWSVPRVEIGYWVRTGYEGHGLATEAAGALTEFALAALKARRVEIRCDALNERSAAIARRLGYVQEARLRHHRRHHLSGELHDTLIFALVVDEVPIDQAQI